MRAIDVCILNAGGDAWAFEPLARQLSSAIGVDISDSPRKYNYLLLADESTAESSHRFFIPYASMKVAADKRELARVFRSRSVPIPETHLVDSLADAFALSAAHPEREWCLKYPTGCGAAGHRLLRLDTILPKGWPVPLVVQEFIRLDRPEVYRTYCAGGDLFGWVVRRFPQEIRPSEWVAHARGARYEDLCEPPVAAIEAARRALDVAGLLQSFGCADLLCRSNGDWVVLEVGTDGMFNHVDRDLGLPAVEHELLRRIAEAFWTRSEID